MARLRTAARPVDLNILFEILVRTAGRPTTITYGELSQIYSRETGGDWHHPREWGHHLGQVNIRLHQRGLPAISAVVVGATDGMPGDGFWGCCSSVPAEKPDDPAEANRAWSQILNRVYATDWPFRL